MAEDHDPTPPNDAVSLPSQGNAGLVGLLPEQQNGEVTVTAETPVPVVVADGAAEPATAAAVPMDEFESDVAVGAAVTEVDSEAVRLSLPRQGDAPEAVTCPSCSVVSFVAPSRRDAAGFCPACDFPLFWAGSRLAAGEDDTDDDGSHRRLPGTIGRSALASVPCPSCRELNQPSAVVCVRCGADMHPAPVPELPAPAPVIVLPEPEPEQKVLWWPPFAAAALLGVLVILAMVLSG